MRWLRESCEELCWGLPPIPSPPEQHLVLAWAAWKVCCAWLCLLLVLTRPADLDPQIYLGPDSSLQIALATTIWSLLLSLDLPYSACSHIAGWCSCWWGCGLAHYVCHWPGLPSQDICLCCPSTLPWPWDHWGLNQTTGNLPASGLSTLLQKDVSVWPFLAAIPLVAEAKNDGKWMAIVMLDM